MKDGFVKVAAGTPKIHVADCRYNAEQIFTLMREADKQGVKVLALPELCLTGYTCGDLFLQETLLRGAEEGLRTILEATKNLDMVTALGLPVRDKWNNKFWAWYPRRTCPITGSFTSSAGSPPPAVPTAWTTT